MLASRKGIISKCSNACIMSVQCNTSLYVKLILASELFSQKFRGFLFQLGTNLQDARLLNMFFILITWFNLQYETFMNQLAALGLNFHAGLVASHRYVQHLLTHEAMDRHGLSRKPRSITWISLQLLPASLDHLYSKISCGAHLSTKVSALIKSLHLLYSSCWSPLSRYDAIL